MFGVQVWGEGGLDYLDLEDGSIPHCIECYDDCSNTFTIHASSEDVPLPVLSIAGLAGGAPSPAAPADMSNTPLRSLG